LLKSIFFATELLSTSNYPTLGDLRMAIITIMKELNKIIEMDNESPPATPTLIATAIVVKLEDYWHLLDKNSKIGAILDPSHKLITFSESELEMTRNEFFGVYKLYSEKYNLSFLSLEATSINSTSTRSYFKKSFQNHYNQSTSNNEFIKRYLEIPEEVNCLDWYSTRFKDPNYIVLSHMARDFFSIQATSVSSESAFSIAKHTLSPVRNRLDPEKARASLCLKSWIEAKIVSI